MSKALSDGGDVVEALILKADGTQERRQLERKLTLEEYQKIVEGYIQVMQVRYEGQVCDMVINEEGLVLGMPDNVQATELLEAYWLEQYGLPEERVPPGMVAHVVGDVVVLIGHRLD